jgi:tetratricopeptide (TPR) repeat protein
VALVSAALMLALGVASRCENQEAFAAHHRQALNRTLPYADRQRAFATAITECPAEVGLYSEQAALYMEHRDFLAALSCLQTGLQLSPRDERLSIQEAAALLALARPRDALKALEAVSSGESSFYKGMAYRLLQDHATARTLFIDAWQHDYQNDYVLYSAIQEDYALGDKKDGLQYFTRLIERYPDSPWVHLLLADAYFSKEQNDDARSEYLKALEKKSDLLEANFRLGYIAFQTGHRESAADYFRREIALNPNYVDAHVFLAETLIQQDQKEEALPELRTALKLDERSDLTYKRLATTLIDLNKPAEAAEILKHAEQRFPRDPSFPAQLARVFTLLHRAAEAQQAAERSRRLTAEQHEAQALSPVK